MSIPTAPIQPNTLVQDVRHMIRDLKDPNSAISTLISQYQTPDQKASIDKQLETFEADIEKMTEGKMSYAEMRRLYG